MMKPVELSRRAKEAFDEISELGSDEQPAALGALDTAVREEVESLMRQDTAGFLTLPCAFTKPSMVGPYILGEEIGAGGMGRVFRASRTGSAMKRPVALKLLPWGRASVDFQRRFRREIELHATLEHRYIARLLDGGTADDLLFLVTEFVDGVPITDHGGRLPMTERLRLFCRTCEAVEFSHKNLVVHRDLKPSNILVSVDGVPHLLDFGIAKLLGEDAGTALTAAGNYPMTPEYASPEQVRGLPITTATDVYSLGVLLCELLTGKRPYSFESRSLEELVRVVCEAEPEPPRNLHHALPRDLEAIILKALRKEPVGRYSSVEAMRQDIERYLAGLPVEAARGDAVYRIGKFLRRNRLAAALGAAILGVLLAGVVSTNWQAQIAEQQRGIAERERARAEVQAREATAQRDRASTLAVKEKEQREVAEKNWTDARTQKGIADSERIKGDSRFNDMRQVATSLLFEFDASIMNVTGTNKARELVVEKGLQYLDKLAKESGGSDALQAEIAGAYERLGSIQGNVFVSSLGDYRKARSTYERAFAIREALYRKHPNEPYYRKARALSLIELADGLYTTGEVTGVIARHREAAAELRMAQARGDRSEEVAQGIQRTDTRLCSILAAAGDVPGALERCRAAIADGRSRRDEKPYDVARRTALAASLSQFGLALRKNKQLRESIEALELAAGELRKLAEDNPTSSRHASNLAGSYALIGGTMMALGEREKAIESFQKGIETNRRMLGVDINDARAKTTLGFGLLQLAPILLANQQLAEADAAAKEGLEIFRFFADRPNATPDDWNNYASFLLEVGVFERRAPVVALSYAQRAVGATKNPNLALMDTLAQAQFDTGNTPEAVATLERALGVQLAANDLSAGLRGEMEAKLKRFRVEATVRK